MLQSLLEPHEEPELQLDPQEDPELQLEPHELLEDDELEQELEELPQDEASFGLSSQDEPSSLDQLDALSLSARLPSLS